MKRLAPSPRATRRLREAFGLPPRNAFSTALGTSGRQAIPLGPYYETILHDPTPYTNEKPEEPPASAAPEASERPEKPKRTRGRPRDGKPPSPSPSRSQAGA